MGDEKKDINKAADDMLAGQTMEERTAFAQAEGERLVGKIREALAGLEKEKASEKKEDTQE